MNTKFIDLDPSKKEEFNKFANHPLQAWEWGDFREKTGIKVIRRGLFENKQIKNGYQMTLHQIPHTKFNIGYLPKGHLPNNDLLEDLSEIGKKYNCIFIQLEPNVEKLPTNNDYQLNIDKWELPKAAHPLFTKHTLVLDLNKTEDELLKSFHPKTRYNIKIAQKHGIYIKEENDQKAFEIYWKIMEETTMRQKFYAHTKKYHQLMFQALSVKNKIDKNVLQAHLFIAHYNLENNLPTSDKKDLINNNNLPLVSWVLFTFKDTLYYPYGSSSSLYKNLMASNLMMWEAIKFGKKLNLSKFDMWGSLGENPDINDPWYGFHKFKLGYNPRLVEFIGSYDLIINKNLYQIYKIVDKLRGFYLKNKKH